MTDEQREELVDALYDEFVQFTPTITDAHRFGFRCGARSAIFELEKRGMTERLRDFVAWIDTWVSHPVGSYSVHALDGLFGMARDKIAALNQQERNSNEDRG